MTTYYARREAGLCTVCGGKRDREGRMICAACAEIVAKQKAHYWAWYRNRKIARAKKVFRPIFNPRRGLLESPAPPAERPAHIFGRRSDGLDHLRSNAG